MNIKQDRVNSHAINITCDRDALENAVCLYQDGQMTIDALTELAYPAIRRIAQAAAHSIGVDDEVEDVIQTLWMMFVAKIAVEYDRSKSIYPLLVVYARNLARNVKWQRQYTPSMPDVLYEQEDSSAEEEQYGSFWGGDPEDVTNYVSRKIALEKVSALLGGAKANPAHGTTSRQKRGIAKRNIDQPSADRRELIEIRKTLCMTQLEFAEALNINVPRLSSWEYGRTKGVPPYYMAKARELLALGNRARQHGKTLFERKAMSEILAEWATSLQLDLEDVASLARLLGVSVPTIRRWRANEVRPPLANLVRYDTLVQQHKRRQGSSGPRKDQSSSISSSAKS